MKREDRETIEMLGKAAGELLTSKAADIAKKVNTLVARSFSQSNLNVAKALQNTLASTQPISSRRRGTDEEIYESLNALKHDTTTVDQAYKVLSQLDESPVAASEILSAGWLYRMSSLEGTLLNTFAGSSTTSSEQIATYCSQVEKIDFMLMKSLELVSVYSEIRRP
ncbi:MAG TPA: hypothetical protein VKB58_02475 [Terriglobales bacterium]|nr:hypothetical protein [Terriglobales bacterium]